MGNSIDEVDYRIKYIKKRCLNDLDKITSVEDLQNRIDEIDNLLFDIDDFLKDVKEEVMELNKIKLSTLKN